MSVSPNVNTARMVGRSVLGRPSSWLKPSSTSNDRHSSTDRYSQYPHARLPSGPVM